MPLPYDIKVKTDQRYWRAFDFIEAAALAAAPGVTATRIDDVNLAVDAGNRRLVITFGHGQLSDLEGALGSTSLPTPYVKGLQADVQLYVFQKMAAEAMWFPKFKLSEFLIGIERDWHPQIRLVTQFSKETAKGLYDGLSRLERALSALADGEVPVLEIAHDVEVLKTLISFYEANGHLHSTAEAESLSFLKAAAFAWIMDLERKKIMQASQRTRSAYDKKIFEIAAEFQMQPWNRVRLPAAMSDYIELSDEESDAAREVVRQHVELEKLLEQLDGRLKERWLGAWQALGSENPDAVSQAANSTVEVLKQVIGKLCVEEAFEDYLERRFPEQVAMVLALRKWIKETRDGLERVKHHPSKQDKSTAEVLMSGAEIIIKLLLRPQ